MLIEWNNKFLIAGTSGTGKTWKGLYLLKEYIRQEKRQYYVFLANSGRDYDNPKHIETIRPANLGFHHILFNSEHAKNSWKWTEILQKYPRLYIETGDLVQEEISGLVDSLSTAFWTLENSLFIIDEAWSFLTRKTRQEPFERLARGGSENCRRFNGDHSPRRRYPPGPARTV